jgi:anaerobic magnesium-protoporphyrin IX monomethyl ester cyclase
MIDVLLLSLPTKNMDYPALSLPTLTASLMSHGYQVVQRDLNTEIRDTIMSEDVLSNLKTKILPALARENVGHIRVYQHLRDFTNLLSFIDEKWSLGEIQQTKELMQRRCYQEVFDNEARFDMALCLFQISRFLHMFFELYVHRPTIFNECGVYDPIAEALDRLRTDVVRLAPRVVGFTILDIQRRFTLWFAQNIRRIYKGKIVFGGADPSRFSEVYLRYYPFIDHVFVREAEESFPQFLRQLDEGKDQWHAIPGLGYRKDGDIRIEKVEYVDASAIPTPNFCGFPLDRYLLPVLPIQASRGCRWRRCKFCIHWRTYSHYYRRPVENVVNDIETLSLAHGTRFFHFTDDELAVQLGTQISDEILRKNLDIRWLTYARLEKQFDATVLSKWYNAGVRVIEWGLESASQRVLDLMDKNIEVEHIQPILEDAARAGILNKLFCFHDYPGETIEDLAATLDFLRYNILNQKIRPFTPIRNKLFLLKGSILYEEAIADANAQRFAKVWTPEGPFSIQADYEDVTDYGSKKKAVEDFLEEIHKYMRERKVYSTDDDNVTMDLVVTDLMEKGCQVARTPL